MFSTGSSVSTDPVIAALPRSALLPAFPAVIGVVGVLSTAPIAAELPIGAFLAAHTTVVPVTEDVPAVCLAAVEEARPIIRRNPVADVVRHGVAACPFLYDAEQEPAPGSEAGWRLGRIVEDVELVLFIEFGRGSERRVGGQEERENELEEEDCESEEYCGEYCGISWRSHSYVPSPPLLSFLFGPKSLS